MDTTADQLRSFHDANSSRSPDFDSLAKFLIDELQLAVFGNRCRLLEVEFYLRSQQHPDPFVHCNETQLQFARWYLHRNGGTLKNGSFKGIDLAVGDGRSHFGVLIRSMKTPTGVVCGPCLSVNYMIQAGGFQTIADLSAAIEGLDVTETGNPVHLVSAKPESSSEIYSCPRVGLSTKHTSKEHDEFAERDYRFLTQPRDIKKGRPELIRGLARKGFSIEKIRGLTGSPSRSILKYSGIDG